MQLPAWTWAEWLLVYLWLMGALTFFALSTGNRRISFTWPRLFKALGWPVVAPFLFIRAIFI
jgi:hypothetical protein